MVADRRSARSTLVVRDRPKDDESYAGFLLRLTEINGYAATRWVRRDAGMPLDLRESTLITRIELDLPSLAESLTLDVKDLKETSLRSHHLRVSRVG